MAIMRALDGTFYEVPEDQANKFKIPQDKLKEKLGTQAYSAGGSSSGGPPESSSGPLVSVHIHYGSGGPGGGGGDPGGGGGEGGGVNPYDWSWHNWRNHNWRNHEGDWHNWRNHWD